MIYRASAPSNIALIKYMGKTDSTNIPTNGSLSYTLDYLKTNVELEVTNEPFHRWEELTGGMNLPIELSETGKSKFLNHLDRMFENYRIEYPQILKKYFLVRSANEFPSDCGLASSASSFAALTKAFQVYVQNEYHINKNNADLAQLSRQGSGSSCRSFFSPWGIWNGNVVGSLELPVTDLLHFVIVVDQERKSVSSSEAHKRVTRSELFYGRPERANRRLSQLIDALKMQNWQNAFEIVWVEFMDMHALFETSHPPFRYRNSNSFQALDFFEREWSEIKDGPLVTMDAGSNVHALYRLDQEKLAMSHMNHFKKNFLIVSDPRLRNKNT